MSCKHSRSRHSSSLLLILFLLFSLPSLLSSLFFILPPFFSGFPALIYCVTSSLYSSAEYIPSKVRRITTPRRAVSRFECSELSFGLSLTRSLSSTLRSCVSLHRVAFSRCTLNARRRAALLTQCFYAHLSLISQLSRPPVRPARSAFRPPLGVILMMSRSRTKTFWLQDVSDATLPGVYHHNNTTSTEEGDDEEVP